MANCLSISLRPERTLYNEAGGASFDRSFLLVVSVSLMMHLAIMFAVLWSSTDSRGGGAVDLETISVTIVTDRDLAVDVAVASGSEPVVVKPSLDHTLPGSDAAPPPTEKAKDEAAEATVREPTPMRAWTEQSRDEHTKEIAGVEESRTEVAAPSLASAANQAPLSIGGLAAGEAAASRGDIDQYAREVALWLARHRPKGIGLKGKVVVEFKLSPDDGTLMHVRVASSSGNTRLDRLAVSAVEHGKYPIPPKGVRAEQLGFRIPFQFD